MKARRTLAPKAVADIIANLGMQAEYRRLVDDGWRLSPVRAGGMKNGMFSMRLVWRKSVGGWLPMTIKHVVSFRLPT